MKTALVILVLYGVAAILWRERRIYLAARRARSSLPPPSAPAAVLPVASHRTPARSPRGLVAGADTPRPACSQEQLAALDLGYLGPHRHVSRCFEAPRKEKRAPESWHSDRGRAPTPGLEFDGTEDIGRSTGPTT